MDEQTRARVLDIELEPGHYVRADGKRTKDLEEADRYEFRAAIFTNGEATDGDIIDIRSLKTGTMPYFALHMADAVSQLGELRNPTIVQDPKGLAAVWDGTIPLGGSGDLRDVRRDVAFRQKSGQLTRMSGRWGRATDGSTVVTRRTKLDRSHPAFVDGSKLGAEDVRQFGNHWQGAQAMEGSLVGLGADPGATVRDCVRDFWQRQSRAADEAALGGEQLGSDAEQLAVTEWAERLLDPDRLAADRSEHLLTDLSDMMKKAIARIDELQQSMDDLRFDLADEPERAEGEETTEEPKPAEGGTPLGVQGLRDLLGDPVDTSSDAQREVQAQVNRLKGMASP